MEDDEIEIKIDDRIPSMRIICNRFTAEILEDVNGITWDKSANNV